MARHAGAVSEALSQRFVRSGTIGGRREWRSARGRPPGDEAGDEQTTVEDGQHSGNRTAGGVSIASVSRALNDKPGISEALRERILTISRDVEYRPSAAARQLISGKAAVVGISLGRRDFELRPYYILLYQHLTVALHRQGMVPIFFAHDRTATLPEQAGAAILLGEFADDPRPELMRSHRVPSCASDWPERDSRWRRRIVTASTWPPAT